MARLSKEQHGTAVVLVNAGIRKAVLSVICYLFSCKLFAFQQLQAIFIRFNQEISETSA